MVGLRLSLPACHGVLRRSASKISATVISGANDLASLAPKWMNIRRGAVFITIVGGWVMVPWKILHSAHSLLSFMNSLGAFLAPIMAIQISDFYLIKRHCLDVPALYQSHGRYRYTYGVNWRAMVAMICSVLSLHNSLVWAMQSTPAYLLAASFTSPT